MTDQPSPAEQAQRRRTGRRLRDTTTAVAETKPAEPEKLPPWVPVHPTVPDWREMDRW